MVDQPTNLDAHRGMSAQKATDLRRLRSEVEADQEGLRARQAALEDMRRERDAWREQAHLPPIGRRPSKRRAICSVSLRGASTQPTHAVAS